MKEILKKYKIFLSVAIYFIAFGAAYFLIARPMIGKIEDENNKIQEKLTDQEIRKDKLSELPSIREQFDMINDQKISDVISISLNNENIVNLIEELEKISDETGNKIKINLPEDKNDNKTQDKKGKGENSKTMLESLASDNYIKVSIDLSGSYSSFLEFIKKIENMKYYSDAVYFKISNIEKGSANFASNPFANNSILNEIAIDENKDKIYSTIECVFYLEEK
ncbi:MAG: hypothetical protein WC906_01215 [Parcubacteria group bacterium]